LAKKKQQTDESQTPKGADSLDAVFQAAQRDMRKHWGERQYVGGAEESRLFCLDAPLALQSLLGLPGLPLGRSYVFVGEPGSCKSAGMYEVGRIFRRAGGGFTLIETEKKESASLLKSISGYDNRRRAVYYARTVEEWQECVTANLDATRKMLAEHDPPSAYPWFFIVDSIGGVTTASVGEAIESEGAAKLVQPQAANILNTYLKRMGHWFDLSPFAVGFVNHLKLSPDRHGNRNVRNMQGGYAPRFHESLEIEFQPVGRQFENRSPVHELGRRIRLKIYKNSLAGEGQPLEVEMRWYFEELAAGGRIQRTYWDWETALVDRLLDSDLPAKVRKEIDALVDIRPVNKGKSVSFASERLGVSEKEPVSARKLGCLIEANQELRRALRGPLGIQDRFVFQPGVDIDGQRREAVQRIVAIPGDGLDLATLPDDPQGMEGARA